MKTALSAELLDNRQQPIRQALKIVAIPQEKSAASGCVNLIQSSSEIMPSRLGVAL